MKEGAGLLDLARAASNGRERAYDELVRSLWPNAYRIALSILGERCAAEDAAQAACAAICAKLQNLSDVRAFAGWSYRIIVSHARDHARARSRLRRRETLGYELASGVSTRDDPSVQLDLEGAIGMLPEPLRLALELHYFRRFDKQRGRRRTRDTRRECALPLDDCPKPPTTSSLRLDDAVNGTGDCIMNERHIIEAALQRRICARSCTRMSSGPVGPHNCGAPRSTPSVAWLRIRMRGARYSAKCRHRHSGLRRATRRLRASLHLPGLLKTITTTHSSRRSAHHRAGATARAICGRRAGWVAGAHDISIRGGGQRTADSARCAGLPNAIGGTVLPDHHQRNDGGQRPSHRSCRGGF